MKERKKWNGLLITPISISVILIVIRFCYTESFENIECKIGLEIYQMIAFVGAISGLLWTNKRYNQGQENLKKTEESLEQNKKIALDSKKQSEEITFKNKMNTQYLEVIKAVSDENQKKTPIVSNLINAIQASIAIFYDTEEKKKKARKEILNFRGANLKGANLIWADLTEADLREVYLTEADLTDANLRGADLINANLTGTYLTGADLTETDLREAYLIKADLIGADLIGVDLIGVDLRGADLTGAHFNISSLNTLSRNQLDSAKNVTKIKIYIDFGDKFYSLKEFVEMKPPNSINDNGKKLKKGIFDYLVKLSKKN